MASDPAALEPRRDVLDGLWRVSSAPISSVVLALLLAVTLALAAIFPQIPSGLEAAAEQRWLSAMAESYGGLGSALQAAGVFDILGGLWLRVLLAVIGYHLLLLAAEQGKQVWTALRSPSAPTAPDGLPLTQFSVAGPFEATSETLKNSLQKRYHVRASQIDPGRMEIYGERHRLGVLGPLLVFAGLLLVLLALAINGRGGWQVTSITLAPKSSTVLPQAGGLRIGLEGITGPDANAVSTFALALPDGRSQVGSAGYARPYHWGNIWVSQQSTGLALSVAARDAAGHALQMQSQAGDGEPHDALYMLFTHAETEQAFEVPSQNLAFRVVSYASLPERGFNGPVFLVEAYRGNDPTTPVVAQLVENEASLAVGDATYSLRRDRHAVLDAAYLPGLIPLAAGAFLALGGGLFCLLWRRSQAWVDLTVDVDNEATATVTATAQPAGGRGELARLLAPLGQAEAVQAE